MAIKKFKHVRISGLEVVIPEKEINIYDEVQYYDNSTKKIDRMRKMVGFYKRRVADNTTTSADLAYDAATKLIKELKIDKSTIEALVFICQQPDVIAPSTAYFIHDKLGLSDDCIATDINQGCVGWLFGLFMVSQMIESGTYKRVLLLNGDTPSVGIDPANRDTAPIFGDAGTATLLEYSDVEIESAYNIETKSRGFEAIVSPFSGKRFRYDFSSDEDFELLNKLRKEKYVKPTGKIVPLLGGYMDGLAVFDFTMNLAPRTITELLNYLDLTPKEIPYLCLHQANKQIVQTVGTNAGFEFEQIPYDAFENYGNNTMCSIPTTLSLLPKEIDKKQICCCAFGNGLVSVAAVLNLLETKICEIKTFEKPSYVKTRDEYINYWRNKIKGEN